MVAAYLRARVTRTGDEGTTAVEYGLLVSLITVVAIAVVSLFGNQLGDVFTSLVRKF